MRGSGFRCETDHSTSHSCFEFTSAEASGNLGFPRGKRTPKPRNVVNLSIDALYRISFRNGHIITTTIIALVFERGLFLGIVFCFFMGAWVGFNFSFVVWASIVFALR